MNQSFCAKLAYLNNKGSDKKKKKTATNTFLLLLAPMSAVNGFPFECAIKAKWQ